MHDILIRDQYGFINNKSTINAILHQLNYIYENLDSGKIVLSIFLDFKKAFNCVSHNILLSKLRHYKLRGITYSCFESYLSNRKQYVHINNSSSSLLIIEYGDLQGIILGPLLFLVFINDITYSSNYFKFVLFADDSTLSM